MASFGDGITVNSTTVSDPTHASANITISGPATAGTRDVNVITGDETPFRCLDEQMVLKYFGKECRFYWGRLGPVLDVEESKRRGDNLFRGLERISHLASLAGLEAESDTFWKLKS